MSREISVGWWNDLSRALFGFQEQRALEFEDALRAVAVLECERPEWAFIKRERRFSSIEIGVAGVVAEFGFIGIENPPDSGVLTVIEAFVNTSVGQEVQERGGIIDPSFTPAIATTTVLAGCRDSREYSALAGGGTVNVSPSSACRMISGTATAAELTNYPPYGTLHAENVVQGQHGLLAAILGKWYQVVGPGGRWMAVATVSNAAIAGVCHVREKQLHKGTRA